MHSSTCGRLCRDDQFRKGLKGSWKGLCHLAQAKLWKRSSQILLDTANKGLSTVGVDEKLNKISKHTVLDRNMEGQLCLPAFACATWTPQGDMLAFCKLLYSYERPIPKLILAKPDGTELLRLELSSNPLTLSWSACGTRLAVLGGGPPPLKLTILDVHQGTVLRKTCSVSLASGRCLYFCWAPNRPSLFARVDDDHMRYDLQPDLKFTATRLQAGFAHGMAPQWVVNAQGREFAVLQIVKYFGFANQTNGLYTLALSEEGAMPQAIDIQQGQPVASIVCVAANPAGSMLCWIEDSYVRGKRLMACLLDDRGSLRHSPWALMAMQGEKIEAFQWAPNGERVLVISQWKHLQLPDPLAEEEPASNAPYGVHVIELRANSPAMQLVAYGRCKPCEVVCSQVFPFWSQYTSCQILWRPDSLAFCYTASHTDVASPHGPSLVHLQRIKRQTEVSPQAVLAKLEGLARGAIPVYEVVEADFEPRVMGPAEHATWCLT
ncbi:hypothetical protein WJX84_006400 [Apatococcus fuscideae]|uniref:Eukaryotic translation initiation factor 2A n=1 Tax=Apatococcus fuscideae TaxID=2026836 RepID=A0AAW1TER2_9CHLO